ncbi:MAG: DUF962 domain-containing protein [Flavobacteriaceae bacterium]|jgi:uncharacterized membrane protein YGL010W|nr:DUF962 domain-containing protein [Flavobacteriaceae bacterium]
MQTLQQLLDKYAESHQNKTNKIIHYFCVPAIFFSVVGLLMSIPSGLITSVTGITDPLYANWGVVFLIPVLVFYIRLSLKMTVLILSFSILCILGNYQLSLQFSLLQASIIIFVIAWIIQFYGHKIEGKKPSFLDDVKFLMVGPAWILDHIFKSKN